MHQGSHSFPLMRSYAKTQIVSLRTQALHPTHICEASGVAAYADPLELLQEHELEHILSTKTQNP